MRHPVRHGFHLFCLLSGSRPGALLEARLEHLNVRTRILPSVNAGYFTRDKLISGRLQTIQEKLTQAVLGDGGP